MQGVGNDVYYFVLMSSLSHCVGPFSEAFRGAIAWAI